MTEQKIEKIITENKKLKIENKKLKEKNDELIKCIEIYQNFIAGGQING